MTISRTYVIIIISMVFNLNTQLFSQQVLGPILPEIPPFEKNPEGKNLLLDYGVDISPFTDKKLTLKNFEKENLLIFYFSAKCPHCQAAYPHIKKLNIELQKQNIKMVAIAAAMNREADIAKFITEFKVDVPVFHDKERIFSKLYGSGNVPLILLVNKKGEFLKFTHFNPNQSIGEIEFAFADKSKF